MLKISVPSLVIALRQMFTRFPAALLATLVGTATICYVVGGSAFARSHNDQFYKIFILAVTGFPWLLFVALMGEKLGLVRWKNLLAQSVGIVIVIGAYFMLPDRALWLSEMLRLIVLMFVGLALWFAPFDRKRDSEYLWRSAGIAVKRAMIAAIFAVALGVGLMLCIGAIKFLFPTVIHRADLHIARAWIVVWGVFAIWFFLAGFPNPKDENRFELTKIPRLFLNFIWLPLLSIFFVILYVYLGKILVTWNWPNGGVAGWIVGFSGVGIGAFLMAHGLLKENKSLKLFFTAFFALVVPMTFMLFVAIGFRIQEYGVTEGRYLIAASGVWLLIGSGYYLISKGKQLRFLPYFAALILLVAVAGPWGMSAVSARSQIGKLREVLEKNGLMVDGKFNPPSAPKKISYEDYSRITSGLRFVFERGGEAQVEWLLDMKIPSYRDTYGFESLVGNLNLSPEGYAPTQIMYLYREQPYGIKNVIDVQGYDFVIPEVDLWQGIGYGSSYKTSAGDLVYDLQGSLLKIQLVGKEVAQIDLWPLAESLAAKYPNNRVPSGEFVTIIESEKIRVKILFTALSIEKKTHDVSSVSLTSLGAIK